MSAVLAAIDPGFAQPVAAAQQVFRTLLEAMSRPGRVQRLPAAALTGLNDAALGPARCALLLALLDADTRAWLDPTRGDEATAAHLQFHTGTRFARDAAQADFAVIDATPAAGELWSQLPQGSDAAPQLGATLLVEVPSLERGLALALRGPGIESVQALRVDGLAPSFWTARIAMERDFPLGIDLVLTCGDRLAALPRSTRVTLEG